MKRVERGRSYLNWGVGLGDSNWDFKFGVPAGPDTPDDKDGPCIMIYASKYVIFLSRAVLRSSGLRQTFYGKTHFLHRTEDLTKAETIPP